MKLFFAGALCALFALISAPINAQTIVNEWSSIKAPEPPPLAPVTVDPKTTALLMLDFVKQTCNEQVRPRCLTSVQKTAKLLKAARDAHATVIYSIIVGSTIADTLPVVAAQSSEPYVQARADKFIGTNLDQMLKDKGIKTVIVVGTTAQGAVMYTGSHAAFLGYNVIVPVDGMSAETPYAEQYVTWNFAHAPLVGQQTKLTTIDTVTF